MVIPKFQKEQLVMSINNATIVGRLGGDPDVKYFESGSCTARLTVYINEKFNKNGETQEETHRIPVEAWGQTAEYCAKYLHQGSYVAVTGALRENRWTDQATGDNRSRLVLKAQRIENLDKKPDDQTEGNHSDDEF
jgi:single-strand DNA-binding protein